MGNQAFAETILHARIEKQMTLREVADSLGIGAAEVSSLEHGRRAPTVPEVRKLARALGLDEHLLLTQAAELEVEEEPDIEKILSSPGVIICTTDSIHGGLRRELERLEAEQPQR